MGDELTNPFDPARVVVGLQRDGKACILARGSGPPPRIDGYTVGAPVMSRPAPHAGEMHPDGDELLFLLSGRASLLLEDEAGERVVEIAAGQAFVVPRGVWHRVVPNEPCQLFHITPGPGGQWRTLSG